MIFRKPKELVVVHNDPYIGKDITTYLEWMYSNNLVWKFTDPSSALRCYRGMDGDRVPGLTIYGQVGYEGVEGGRLMSWGEFARKLREGPWDDDNMRRVCIATPLAFVVDNDYPDIESEGLRKVIGAPRDAPITIRTGRHIYGDLGNVARYYLGEPSGNSGEGVEILKGGHRGMTVHDMSVASDDALLTRVVKMVNAGDIQSRDPQ